MTTFFRTRSAADFVARNGPSELARARAGVLLARLHVCKEALASQEEQPPVVLAGLFRDLVLATRDLAGPAWLAASGDDPDVAAFTALEATASPPDPARIDQICSRVLWARFGPDGTARDRTGEQTAVKQPAGGAAQAGPDGQPSHAY